MWPSWRYGRRLSPSPGRALQRLRPSHVVREYTLLIYKGMINRLTRVCIGGKLRGDSEGRGSGRAQHGSGHVPRSHGPPPPPGPAGRGEEGEEERGEVSHPFDISWLPLRSVSSEVYTDWSALIGIRTTR